MGEFEVPGARLHTQSRGTGPLLLLIHGGNGDCDVYDGIAGPLAEHFTVVSYVRRGFARSPLDAPPDDATRIATDAADAAALIAHHGDGPAFVFGSSSGAIVALDLVTRHPELVRTAVVHEPPVLALLADPAAWQARFAGVKDTYATAGLWPAFGEFGRVVGLARPVGGARPEEEAMARAAQNMTFWFEHEFETYPAYRPDLDALDGVVPAGGADSVTDISVQPPQAIAKRLGREVVLFPGGHVGYGEHPAEFGTQLGGLLRSGR